jgi:hypothetical protein
MPKCGAPLSVILRQLWNAANKHVPGFFDFNFKISIRPLDSLGLIFFSSFHNSDLHQLESTWQTHPTTPTPPR